MASDVQTSTWASDLIYSHILASSTTNEQATFLSSLISHQPVCIFLPIYYKNGKGLPHRL